MTTRQERMDAFVHEGMPPTDQPLKILCEDHVGTYVIPFLCRWHDGVWRSVKTDSPIEAAVIGVLYARVLARAPRGSGDWKSAQRSSAWAESSSISVSNGSPLKRWAIIMAHRPA
jgi:hypothetical protein